MSNRRQKKRIKKMVEKKQDNKFQTSEDQLMLCKQHEDTKILNSIIIKLMYDNREQFRICILESYSNKTHLNHLVEYLKKMGYKNVSRFLIKRNSFEELMEIESIISQKFDIYFNLCDGSIGVQDLAGPEVARYLTYANVPFVGPDINCAQPSRNQMKDVCRQHNIKTPAFQFVFDLQNDIKKLDVLKFPLIVKHYNSAGSWGMTRQSKVTNKQDLRIQLQRMLKLHGGSLVQQFIEGRQFTCMVVQSDEEGGQPFAYEPVEYGFRNPDDDFKYQLIKFSMVQVTAYPVHDTDISQAVKAISSKFFKEMKMRSYARVDIRMNAQNQLYILQINPNPALYYNQVFTGSGDEILRRGKGTHSAFIERMFKCAIRAYKNQKPFNGMNAKQICLREMKKEKRVLDLKLPGPEEMKILVNLYYQSLQVNNNYRAGLSKDILKMLKTAEQIEYIFNEDELKKLES